MLALALDALLASCHPRPTADDRGGGRLLWIGGPTALIERGGLRLLTDPMLGPRGPHAFTLPRHPSTGQPDAPIARYTDPAPVQLAGLDAVILSHGHNDHFDQTARDTIPHETLFITPPGVEAAVRAAGFTQVRTLDWGQSTVLEHGGGRVRVTAVPAHHAHDATLDAQIGRVNGYVLAWEGAAGPYTVYWTGDCVLFDGQAEAVAPFAPIDLLLPHMGAVGSDGPVGLRTLDADEASTLVERVNPRRVIPIHHTTFGHYREPVSALAQRAAARGWAARLTVLPEGGSTPLGSR